MKEFSLIDLLLSESVSSETLVSSFMNKYPEIYKEHPIDYYSGKCSIVSALFAEMCFKDFKIPKVYNVVAWKQEWLDEFKGDKRKGNHTVVLIDNITYDMTSAQLYKPDEEVKYYKVLQMSDFIKDYAEHIVIEQTLEKAVEYKRTWAEYCKGIARDTSSKPEMRRLAKRHYNDLHKFGYI